MNNQVRVVVKDGEPWFVAADVAKVLDYRDAHSMVRVLDADEKDTHTVSTLGGEQTSTIITESGLYHAVLKSRKPEAIKFRKWVTTEVLPSIRKNKAYIKPDATAENIAAAMTPSQQLEFFEKSLALLSKCGVLEDWHKRLVGDAVSNLW